MCSCNFCFKLKRINKWSGLKKPQALMPSPFFLPLDLPWVLNKGPGLQLLPTLSKNKLPRRKDRKQQVHDWNQTLRSEYIPCCSSASRAEVSPGSAVPAFHTPSGTFPKAFRRKKQWTPDQPEALWRLHTAGKAKKILTWYITLTVSFLPLKGNFLIFHLHQQQWFIYVHGKNKV